MLKARTRKIVVYSAVTGLLIFLHALGILRPAENILTGFLNPVLKKIHSFSSDLRVAYNKQTSKTDLQETNRNLKIQLNQLIEENARLKIVEEENAALREHLRFLTKEQHQYIMSNIISRGGILDISDITGTIIIDKGYKDGVYDGLVVVSGRGIVVGKVINTRANVSEVYLTNNNKCKLAAAVLGYEKTSGIVEGDLGLTIKMGFLPQDIDIQTENVVITSGLEQSIPRGLVIGRVTEVNRESNELWQTATIEPIVDPEELSMVAVLLPISD